MKKGKFNPTHIYNLRKELNLTQLEIAKKLGCDIKTYREYEKGSKVPGSGLLMEMYAYYKKMGVPVSTDYILGLSDCRTFEKDFINRYIGLSDTAIECLRSWNKDKTWLKDYSNDIDTINTILEYYGKQRKKATKNGGFPNFSIFHFIGNYLNAHKFKRVQQDDIIFRSGKGKNSHLEKGDTVIKKDTGKTVEVKEIYPPVNSRSNRGYDTSQIDLVNTENENEMYYMPVSNIYREYAKSQIQKQLDKIGGFD